MSMMSISMMLIIFVHHGAPFQFIRTAATSPANVQISDEYSSVRVFAAASKPCKTRHYAAKYIAVARKSPSTPSKKPPITSLSVGNDRQPARQERGAQLAKSVLLAGRHPCACAATSPCINFKKLLNAHNLLNATCLMLRHHCFNALGNAQIWQLFLQERGYRHFVGGIHSARQSATTLPAW